jgi:signal transduction histidine kinase
LYTRQFSARTGIGARFDARQLRVSLPLHYETALYKVLQGALSNVAAHSGARHVKISLSSRADGIVMKVEDDGRGFDVGSKLRKPPNSYGLRAMRDRIELLGGKIEFESRRGRAAQSGTVIGLHLPLPGTEPSA